MLNGIANPSNMTLSAFSRMTANRFGTLGVVPYRVTFMFDQAFAVYASCPHLLNLNEHGDDTLRAAPSAFQTMANAHASRAKAAVLATLPVTCNLSSVPLLRKAEATLAALAAEHPLIYGGRLQVDGIDGQPDLLERSPDGRYLPGLLLSGLSAEAGLSRPARVRLALADRALLACGHGNGMGDAFIIMADGSRVTVVLQPSDFATLAKDSPERREIDAIRKGDAKTRPALGASCQQCDWKAACKAEVQALDDLTRIAELGRSKRDVLIDAIPTVEAMARIRVEDYLRDKKRTIFPGIGPASLAKFKERAACLVDPSAAPYLKRPLTLPNTPSTIFFDLETDPFAANYVYLHGFVEQTASGREFRPVLTPTVSPVAERNAFAEAWQYLVTRVLNGHACVIYYSPFEKTTYLELARRYPEVASVEMIEAFFDHPHVIDLYTDWVRPHSVWPCSDLSIKTLAKFVGFSWRDTDPSGANSIVWFHDWVENGNASAMERVLFYNEDDNIAVAEVLSAMQRMPVRATAN